MKGQYLAVESVLTVGMGLTLAIGTIATFSSYQDQVVKTTKDKQVETIQYRVKSAVYSLKGADSGRIDLSLPQDVGGVDYTLTLNRGVTVITPSRNYNSSLKNLQQKQTRGSVSGGAVTLYKSGNQFTLRSN